VFVALRSSKKDEALASPTSPEQGNMRWLGVLVSWIFFPRCDVPQRVTKILTLARLH
jgi:hypothetical protein